jgi:hypothetical protein
VSRDTPLTCRLARALCCLRALPRHDTHRRTAAASTPSARDVMKQRRTQQSEVLTGGENLDVDLLGCNAVRTCR